MPNGIVTSVLAISLLNSIFLMAYSTPISRGRHGSSQRTNLRLLNNIAFLGIIGLLLVCEIQRNICNKGT